MMSVHHWLIPWIFGVLQPTASLDLNLVKFGDGPFGSTIHTIPRLTPTENYDDHMEDIHAEALRKAYGKEAPNLKVLHLKTGGSIERTREDRPGFVFGFGFVSAVVFVCLFYSMVKSKGVLRKSAWTTLDCLIGVFLASLWINAFDSMLEFNGISNKYEVLVSGVHALLVLTVVLWLSFRTRNNEQASVIFMTVGSHYVVFSSIHFATKAHTHYFSESDWWSLIGFGVLFFFYGIVIACTMQSRMFAGDPKWVEQAKSTEDSFAGVGLAVVWGVCVRAWIAGEYHELQSFGGEDSHTATERWMLLIYSLVMLPIVAFSSKKISEATDRTENPPTERTKRLLRILSVFLTMTVVWGFIMWGEWEFHEHLFKKSHITGGLVFAILSTLLGASGVLALSYVDCEDKPSLEASQNFAFGCISYFIGVGWSTCISAAMEDMASIYTHHGIVKVWLCVLLFAIVIPPYLRHFKTDMKEATATV